MIPENTCLHAELAGNDWQTIIAREMFYHRTCYREITRKRDAKQASQDATDKVFLELTAVIEEKIIIGCEVIRMADLAERFAEIQAQLSCEQSPSSVKIQSLKEKIQKWFGAKVGFW